MQFYENFYRKYDDPLYLKERMIVTLTNEIIVEINKKMLEMVPTEWRTYYNFDSICNNSTNFDKFEILYPQFLNISEFNCFPQHELNLKINALIIMLRNLNSNLFFVTKLDW